MDPNISDLKSFAQAFQPNAQLGTKRTDGEARAAAFALLQRRIDWSFHLYLGVLAILFIAIIAFSWMLRDSPGVITAVLGGGGILLGGVLKLIGGAWKEKARLDFFSVLLYGLPEDQLGVVFQKVAKGL